MRRRIAWLALSLLALLALGAAGVLGWRWIQHERAEREARQAVYFYIRLTERYSAPEVWGILPYASPRALTQTYSLLTGIAPPPEMVEAHAELIEGYKIIFGGQKLLLQGHADGVVRAEAEFMEAWGLARVREHYRLIREYREKHPP